MPSLLPCDNMSWPVSVCLSGSRRRYQYYTKCRIMQTMPYNSCGFLVNSNGVTSDGAPNTGGIGKNWQFTTICLYMNQQAHVTCNFNCLIKSKQKDFSRFQAIVYTVSATISRNTERLFQQTTNRKLYMAYREEF